MYFLHERSPTTRLAPLRCGQGEPSATTPCSFEASTSMDTKTKREQPSQPTDVLENSQSQVLNFDAWAAQVRQQMLASLRKRGAALED